MMAIAIISFLFGATLGSRYVVSILFPAVPFVFGVAVVTSVIQGNSLWSTVLDIFLILSLLEIGYLIGAAIRPITEPIPAPQSSVVEPNTVSHSTS